jgi:ribosome biogenesis GTPase / thiamine phosphate phosphatase
VPNDTSCDRARSSLRAYGFDDFFEDSFAKAASEGESPARVVEEQRGRYRIARLGEDGSAIEEEAQAGGILRRQALSASGMPVVGDWAAVKPSPGGMTMIRSILPRRGAFLRKSAGDAAHDRIDAQAVAANVDTALIVAAAGRDWNPRRIERYLALARSAGAVPVLAITKADLAGDPWALLVEAGRIAPGAAAALVCAPEGRGLEALEPVLRPGSTSVLIGSSGAGKSTLLNALAGEALAETGEVREDDQRGRHTTTHRELFRLGSGALVIDTPGMRELQLWADEEEVGAAFPEIEALAEACRFRDCRHGGEPGCAVRAALEAGTLEAGRFDSWRKLAKEAAFLRTRVDHAAKESERRRWRSIEMSRRSFAKETARMEGRRNKDGN